MERRIPCPHCMAVNPKYNADQMYVDYVRMLEKMLREERRKNFEMELQMQRRLK